MPRQTRNLPVSKNNDVEVYYFHMTVRCTTCKTVEAEARKNVEMLYADQVKAGKISFIALNLEEATGKAMGEKLGVNSQTLLIVRVTRRSILQMKVSFMLFHSHKNLLRL